MASRNRERRQKRRRKKRIKPAVKITIASILGIALLGSAVYYKIYQNTVLSQMMGGIDSQDLEVDEDDLTVTKGNVSYTAFNAGSGEAILIKSGSKEALIDTGTEKGADKLCEKLAKKVEGELDYLVLTAAGDGRLGGLAKITEKFDIGTCIVGEMEGEAANVANLTKNAGTYVDGENLSYDLGDYATLFIIKPEVSSPDIEDKSLITYFTFGSSGFLALSDAGKEEISRAFGNIDNVNTIVLSRFGAEEPNLALSGGTYNYCVASAPKGSEIPSEKLAEKLKGRYYITGSAGDLEFISDGNSVTLTNEEEINEKARAEAEKAAEEAAKGEASSD